MAVKKTKIKLLLTQSEKKDFENLALDILEEKSAPTKEKNGTLHYKFLPNHINSKRRLDIINALLVGLSHCIEKKTEYNTQTYALITEANYIEDKAIDVWVDPDALSAAKRYLKDQELYS